MKASKIMGIIFCVIAGFFALCTIGLLSAGNVIVAFFFASMTLTFAGFAIALFTSIPLQRKRAEFFAEKEAQLDYLVSAQQSQGSAQNQPLVADELIKLKSLLDSGAITPQEYETQKRRLLGT